MHSASNGVLEVKCGGDSDASDAGASAGYELVTGGSSNVFWLQLYNPDTGLLLRNVSSKVLLWDSFRILSKFIAVSLVLYAS